MARDSFRSQDDAIPAIPALGSSGELTGPKSPPSTFSRIAKYAIIRAIVLAMMLVVGVYIAIIVANLGGFVDDMVRERIDFALMGMAMGMRDVPAAEKLVWLEETRVQMERAAGLYEPFLLRCLRWLPDSMLLKWADPTVLTYLPNTLLLFGAASILLFFAGLSLSLFLSRKYDTFTDKMVVALSPLSSAPSWAHGIILVIIFAVEFRILPFSGMFDGFPPSSKAGYALVVAKHMLLPVSAILLSTLFQVVYAWRTYFLINAGEDYVEMAKAKGLPGRMIERAYVLRPALPYLITSFALLVLSFWQTSIALEYFFHWPGIGKLYVDSIRASLYNPGPVVNLVVVFAYALAVTIYLLDFVYALVDPRVRIGGGGPARKTSSGRGIWAQLTRWRVRPWPRKARTTRGWSAGRRPAPAGWAQEGVPGETSVELEAKELDLPVLESLTGQEVLEEVLGDFWAVEDAQADWLVETGTGERFTVSWLYPELGLAVSFGMDGGRASRVLADLCRRAGIALVTMEADQPVSSMAMREMLVALSGTSRRVAQQLGAHQVKLDLMPQIAIAKAACQRFLEQADRSALPRPPVVPSAAATPGVITDRRRRRLGNLRSVFREMARYPSAVVGLAIIVILIAASIYTVIAIPPDDVVKLWRGDEDDWIRNPRNAQPSWVNFLRKDKLPGNLVLDSRKAVPGELGDASLSGETGMVTKRAEVVSEGMIEITILYAFDYSYAGYPQDLVIYYEAQYDEKLPLVSVDWRTPDGRELEIRTTSIVSGEEYRLSQDARLQRKLGDRRPERVLFTMPGTSVPLKGTYELQISVFVFEEDADVDAEVVLFGQVYGLAGTDHRRRDLMVALLWGTPVALSLGFLGAVFSSLLSMVVAAVGVWHGGWMDEMIQRVTEVNMILPVLPLCITIYFLYSKNIWVVLALAIIFTAFGSAVKNYRAAFLQVREAPYIEAAQAYGAGNWRIIRRYLVPRIVPVLVPQLVILIPGYVFLEATLAILGVSDRTLPTWGKVVHDALSQGAFQGHYYWVLEPIVLLMITGLAFAMFGFALDRILNPRLRQI